MKGITLIYSSSWLLRDKIGMWISVLKADRHMNSCRFLNDLDTAHVSERVSIYNDGKFGKRKGNKMHNNDLFYNKRCWNNRPRRVPDLLVILWFIV